MSRCLCLKSAAVTFHQTAGKQSSCEKELWEASPGVSNLTPLPTDVGAAFKLGALASWLEWMSTCLIATRLSRSLDSCPTLLPPLDLLCCSCLGSGGLYTVSVRSLPSLLCYHSRCLVCLPWWSKDNWKCEITRQYLFWSWENTRKISDCFYLKPTSFI